MQITVRYQSIDGVNTRKTFATIPGVKRYVDKMVGANAEFGSSGMYAVSSDGVGKVTLVEVMDNNTGRPLNSLAAVLKKEEPPQPSDDEIIAEAMRADAEAEAAMFAAFYPPDPGPRRSPGCTCSDMQLNLVGCDCAAERN